EIPFVVVTSPDKPYKDFKSFIAYAKANPGKLNVSGGSAFSDGYFGLLQLKAVAGIDFLLVPTKSSAEGIPAQLNGLLDVSVFNGAVKPQVDSGKLIPLAVTGRERWDQFPTMPTILELGYDLSFHTASGVIGPAKMQPAVVNK